MNTETYYLSEHDINTLLSSGEVIEMTTKEGNLVRLVPMFSKEGQDMENEVLYKAERGW